MTNTDKKENPITALMDLKKYEIPESMALNIKNLFEPKVEDLIQLEGKYNDIIHQENITKELCKEAGELRKTIKKLRTPIEKIRKAEKEPYLRGGQAIDWIGNGLRDIMKEKEANLEKIQNHFEILEEKRIAKLEEERIEKIKAFNIDWVGLDLGKMPDKEFETFYQNAKEIYEEGIKTEKEAEEKRIKEELQITRERALIKLGVDWTVYNLGDMSDAEYYKLYAEKEVEFNKKQEEEEKRKEKEKLIEQKKKEEEEEKQKEEKLKKDKVYKDFIKKNEGKYDVEKAENGKIYLYKIVDQMDIL